MPGISYDDSGALASYFGVTFLAFILLPITFIVFPPSNKGPSPLPRNYSMAS